MIYKNNDINDLSRIPNQILCFCIVVVLNLNIIQNIKIYINAYTLLSIHSLMNSNPKGSKFNLDVDLVEGNVYIYTYIFLTVYIY